MRFAVLALLVMSAGCRKKATPPEEAPVAVLPVPKELPSPVSKKEIIEVIRQNFKRVHFAFDSTTLDEESKEALSDNAKLLQEHVDIRVQVQGHSDDRGTTDYNLALGQRRAHAIRDRLEQMGVPGGRVTLVSYGEERPRVEGSGESVWSENRRAEFRVLAGNDVQGSVE